MSRIDKLKEQNPSLDVSFVDMISSVDPTTTNKYIDFLIKMLKKSFSGDGVELQRRIIITLLGTDNIDSLIRYEEHSRANRIKNPDISSYKSFKDIKNQVEIADEILRLKELEREVNKIYEDDSWLVVIPLSFEASKMYGSSTKWCTTQQRYYEDYSDKYSIYYIINKRSNVKWAISSNDEKIQGWDSADREINVFTIPLPVEIMSHIMVDASKGKTISDYADKRYEDDTTKPHVRQLLTDSTYQVYNDNINDLTSTSMSIEDYINSLNVDVMRSIMGGSNR
jgi:hypothetical protein